MMEKPNLKLYLLILTLFFILVFLFTIAIQNIQKKVELSLENKVMSNVSKVTFQTDDGVTIVGHYYAGERTEAVFLLIHMRPATKESYQKLAQFLQNKGYSSLAIDLRGHGESIESTRGILNYNQMTPEEEQASILDLEAASRFLEQKGFPKEKQILIGASIGANLSFQFLHYHPEIPAVVLLSPGLNYRGIILENYKDNLDGKKILAIFAKDDIPEALKAYQTLPDWFSDGTFWLYDRGRHGTDILEANPELLTKMYFWIQERLALK